MAEYIKYIIPFLSGGVAGSLLTWWRQSYANRLQKMECQYVDDEVLSKIPINTNNGCVHENIYCKTFKLINTTNKDITRFKVIFQFDQSSEIIESYNRTKSGHNEFKMKKGRQANECTVQVENFNRKGFVEFTFKIANIKDNLYYITEAESTGFKIKCKDKRKSKVKIKSQRSDCVLTSAMPVSSLE